MIKVYLINSFVTGTVGGNPAGVVLDLDHTLDEVQMQQIATKVGVSETAFIKSSLLADFEVRFFTPTDEVPLCGHATIASFWLLREKGLFTQKKGLQQTKAGILEIDLDSRVYMRQTTPVEISESLAFNASFEKAFPNLHRNIGLPVAIWSTGLSDILLPVADRNALLDLKPDFNALTLLSQEHEVVGAHAFAIEDGKILARNFAPLYGIDEESATGTSNGALCAYLHKHLFRHEDTLSITVLQGESMNMPSTIYCKSNKKTDPEEIWVGGDCLLMNTLTI